MMANDEINVQDEETHASPPNSEVLLQNSDEITIWFFVFQSVPLLFYFIDTGIDMYFAYQYIENGEKTYFWLTTACIVIPTLIGARLSMNMKKIVEEESYFSMPRYFGFLLHLTPIPRYADAIVLAWKMRKKCKPNSTEYKTRSAALLVKDFHLSMVRLTEVILEAAPQLVLQITLLLRTATLGHLGVFQYAFICFSSLNIPLALTICHRTRRRGRITKRNMSWSGSTTQFFWFFFVTSSRVLAISEAASVYPRATFVACVVHGLLMTLWTWMLQKENDTPFFRGWPSVKEFLDWMFTFPVMGFIQIIAILPTDLKRDVVLREVSGDEKVGQDAVAVAPHPNNYIFRYWDKVLHISWSQPKNRSQYSLYYIFFFIENAIALWVWCEWATPEIQETQWFLPLAIYTLCSFFIGIVFMLMYYWFFHPERGICLASERQNEHYESELRKARAYEALEDTDPELATIILLYSSLANPNSPVNAADSANPAGPASPVERAGPA